MGVFGDESGVGVITCFRHPFGIAVTRTSMLIHCHDLCFSGDSIKELFDIVTDSRTKIVWELLLILQEHNMVQCQIVDGFPFAVGSNVGWKCIGVFKSYGHLITDSAG